MNSIITFLILFCLFIYPNTAHAYLDPGTGSIIIQAILGFIAASVATVSIYWTKFKMLIKKIFRKKKDQKN